MPESLSEARSILKDLLAPNGTPAVPGITRVFDYEPMTGDGAKPAWVTIFAAGMTPDFYVLELRVYVTAEANPIKAQRDLDGFLESVDYLVDSRYGPSKWTIGYVDELAALVATCTLDQIGRE